MTVRGSLGGALFAVAVLAGCGGLPPLTPPPRDPPGRFVELTAPFVAIGDTQEHEATGFPMTDNDSAIDPYVEVAQRPPEQPLFGRSIMDWVIARHPREPLLHLGDVLDVSCWSEAHRMDQIFRHAAQPLAIVPGNHDGLLFGIFNYRVDDIVRDPESARWDRACRNGTRLAESKTRAGVHRAALTKRDFVELYLQAMRARHPGARLDPPADDGVVRWSWRNPDPAGFLAAIEMRLTPERRYARSFLLQKLRLAPASPQARRVVVVAIDTNQLNVVVGALDAVRGRSPGNVGHMYAHQFAALEALINEARAQDEVVVLAGHHDWASIEDNTRQRLGGILRRLDHPLVYLSAHTHAGFWSVHPAAGRRLLELNVSSLSDWPIAYRRISFALDAEANRIRVTASLEPAGSGAADDRELLRRWQEQTCARAGVPVATLEARDLALVHAQREHRGTLFEWIREQFYETCEGCRATLFEHGHRYQDLMLTEIRQARRDLGRDGAALDDVEMPPVCTARDLAGCVDVLLALRPADDAARIDQFRMKAELVDHVNLRLDQLRSPRARAYMTCRAVTAAKDDFDLTPVDSIPWRSEARRRAGDFFRTEATIGMD